MADSSNGGGADSTGHIVRHARVDRWFHWLSAACVLLLLATAFLPILGVKFGWLTVHWVTGLALIALLLFHSVRSLISRRFGTIWIGRADLREAAAIVSVTLRSRRNALPKPGKYSFAQKLVHWLFALVLLAAAVSGALMLASIDTPWWHRNPYWLADRTWGVVYVLHDLAALLLIPMVMAHVYFGLRPEKRQFLRAMAMGWITRGEYLAKHDPTRWRVNE